MKKKMLKHIESFERDCPHCVELIKAPMPKFRVTPYLQSPLDKKKEKIMQKVIDYTFAQAKGSKILRTPFGVLMWTPKKLKP